MPPKKRPKIEEVTQEFGKAHAEEADAKKRMDKFRKIFFDLITIPDSELATQVIYIECDDPYTYIASLYPKWRVVKAELDNKDIPDEWRVIIQEDPAKKTFIYNNPLDGKVYQRTVAESAPQIDLVRLAEEQPEVYESITFQPDPPPRALRPLDELSDGHKDIVKQYLLPPKLTNRMEKPRMPKDDE